MLSRADKIFIALIGAGVLSIYLGIVNMYIWLGIMLMRMFMLNRVELGIFSLLLGSNLFGRLFASDILVVIFTTGFLILGYILLRKEMLKTIIQNKISSVVFILLLLYFLIMYLLGPMNPYATGKISRLVIRGTTWILLFQIYVQNKNINNNNFAILFALVAIFYLTQAYTLYGIRPNGLFDVSFFREVASEVGRDDTGTLIVNPHVLGYLSVGAFVFFISKEIIDIKSIWNLFFITMLLLISIMSGARQTMIVFIAVMSLRIMLSKGNMIKNSLITMGCALMIIIAILNIGSSSIEKSMGGETMGDVLNRDIEMPFKVMAINPINGVGFGGYVDYANKEYPHNMLLEIFAEFGLIGSIVISIFFITAILVSDVNIKYKTQNNSYFILFLLVYMANAMISSDLSRSIVIFALLLSFVRNPEQYKYLQL